MAVSGNDVAAMFFGQLSGLLKAGMPLPQALQTLAAEADSPKFRAAINRAAAAIESGMAPEDAFAAEEAALGGMLARVSAASAASGQLAPLLSELSAWTLTQERIRRRMVDALAYPFIVMWLASAICVVLMVALYYTGVDLRNEVIEVAGDAGDRMLPDISFTICALIFMVLSILSLLSLFGRFSLKVKHARERLQLKLPILRAVYRSLALARFCGGVSLLMKAGVPFHSAVAASGELSGSQPYAAAAREAARILESGGSQTKAFSDIRLFPASLRFILASAEQRGDIPGAFAELAQIYEIEAEARGRIIVVLAPPACFIAVGAIISLFVYGVFKPVVEIMYRIGI